MNHTITLDVSDLTGDITIKLVGPKPPTPAPAAPAPAPEPDPGVAGVLARLRSYGDQAAIDALYDGLRGLGLTVETARSSQPKPPAYLRYLRDGVFVLSANTARIDVARRTLEANPALRDALLALPGAEPRDDMVIVPVATLAQAEAVLAVLRRHLGGS